MNEAERRASDPQPVGEHFEVAPQPERFQGRLIVMAALIAVIVGGIIALFIRHH